MPFDPSTATMDPPTPAPPTPPAPGPAPSPADPRAAFAALIQSLDPTDREATLRVLRARKTGNFEGVTHGDAQTAVRVLGALRQQVATIPTEADSVMGSIRTIADRQNRPGSGTPQTFVPNFDGSAPTGMVAPGNIDIRNRPRVKGPDGSVSTVRSMSIGTPDGEVLIPTVSDDGRLLTDEQAIDLYRRTGRQLGVFATPEAATEYAQTLHQQQDTSNPYRTIPGAAPATPAPPPGWNPGTPALGVGDIPVIGPAVRLAQSVTETPNEALARQYATPQYHGPAGVGIQALRMAGGVMDPGGAAINSAASTLEQGGGPIQAAASGGISAALNVARMPFLDALERAGAGLVSREAPDVLQKAAGLAARGVGAGVGYGEAQAAADAAANLPRQIGQQAEAGSTQPIKAAIAEEFNRLVAAQPEILTSGALGGIVAEFAMKAAGAGINRLADRQTVVGMPDQPVTATPRPTSATQPPKPITPPVPPAAPVVMPDSNPAAVKESTAAATNPTPKETSHGLREAQGRQEGLLNGTAPTPPGELTPGGGSPRPTAPTTPNPEPVRSGEAVAAGEVITDPRGQRYTAGTTLGDGKVVLRREDGRAFRLTAGEMEARGWKRTPQEPQAAQGEPPARIDAGEPSSQPDGVPANGGQGKGTPEGPIKVGDPVQWTSQGVAQFPEPRKVESFATWTDGRQYAKLEGSSTLIPLDELAHAATPPAEKAGKQPWEMTREEFTAWNQDRNAAHAEADKRASIAEQVFGAEDPRAKKLRAEADRLKPESDIVTVNRKAVVSRALQAEHEVPDAVLAETGVKRPNPPETPEGSPRPEESRSATPEVAPENPAESPKIPETPRAGGRPGGVEVPKADAPGYLDRVVAWAEAKAREGRTPRPSDKPGARFGGSEVNVYDVIAAAAKVVRGGVRTLAKVREVVREMLGKEDPETTRKAWSLVKAAETKDGTHDDGRFELAVSDLLDGGAEPNTKATIREKTGQTSNEADSVTQAEALRGSLAAEEKGARKAAGDAEKVRAAQEKRDARRMQAAVGLERGAAEQSAEIQAGLSKLDKARALSAAAEKSKADRQAMREDFADQLDTLKAKADVGEDIRRQLADAARRYLDPTDLPKVLPLIAKARALEPRTVTREDGTKVVEPVSRQWYDGLRRILDIADQSAAKKARAALMAGVGGPERPKSKPRLAAEINKRLGVLPEKVDLTRGVVDPEKMAPENRDAAAPIIQNLKRGFTSRPALDTLADHLRAKVDQGLSGWADDTRLAELKAIGTRPIKELTAEQAELLHDALHHLDFLNKSERSMVVMGKEMDRQKAHEDIRSGLEKRYNKNLAHPDEIGALHKAVRDMKTFLGQQFRGFGHLVDVAFGKDGTAYTVLFRNPHRGESKAMASAEKAKDAIRQALVDHKVTESELAKWKTKKESVKLPGGSRMELTKAERIDLAGLWSDPDNRDIMLSNGVKYRRDKGNDEGIVHKLAADDYDAITASMTPAERAVLDAFKRETNGRLAKEMNEASVRMDGYEIATNPEHYSRSVDTSGSPQNLPGQAFKMRRWLEDMGILQERTKHARPVLIRNFFDFADPHIDKVARYAHLAEPVRDALIALGDPQVRSAMLRKLGEPFIKRMEDHYEYASGTGAHTVEPDQNMWRRWIGWGAVLKLWGRPTSAAMQKVGFLVASQDAANAAEALRIASHAVNPKIMDSAAYEDMVAHSGALAVRHNHGAGRLVDFSKGEKSAGIGSKLSASVTEAGLKPLDIMDRDVSVGIFKEIRETIRKENPKWSPERVNEEAAIRTEEMVGRTQNPIQRMDRSQMERDADTNAFRAAMMLFSSAGVRAGNMIQSRVYEAIKNPTRENKGWAAYTLATGALGAVIAETIREEWRKLKHGHQDEQFPRDWTEHTANVAADLANQYVPGAGDIVRGTVNSIRKKPANVGSDSFAEAVVAGVQNLITLGEATLSEDEADRDKAWKRFGHHIGGSFAPVDAARGVYAATSGPEAAPWSIKAALLRGDGDAAQKRIQAFIENKVVSPPAKYTDQKDEDEIRQEARSSLRSSLLRMSGTKFDKLTQEQKDALEENPDRQPSWYDEEMEKYQAWIELVDAYLSE